MSATALVVSVIASGDQVEELAPPVAERVAGLVVQDARAERVAVGRRKLAEANTQLIARDLPIVADPGDTATGDELVIAAATARVLAILPDSTVARLRDEVRSGRTPAVLPSSTRVQDLPLGDGVVEVIPDPAMGAPQSQGGTVNSREPRAPAAASAPSPRNPATARVPAPRNPGPASAPAPAAPNRDRGLCLLGLIGCER